MGGYPQRGSTSKANTAVIKGRGKACRRIHKRPVGGGSDGSERTVQSACWVGSWQRRTNGGWQLTRAEGWAKLAVQSRSKCQAWALGLGQRASTSQFAWLALNGRCWRSVNIRELGCNAWQNQQQQLPPLAAWPSAGKPSLPPAARLQHLHKPRLEVRCRRISGGSRFVAAPAAAAQAAAAGVGAAPAQAGRAGVGVTHGGVRGEGDGGQRQLVAVAEAAGVCEGPWARAALFFLAGAAPRGRAGGGAAAVHGQLGLSRGCSDRWVGWR